MILHAEALDWLGRAVGGGGSSLAIVPIGGSTSSSLFRIERTGALQPSGTCCRVLDNREWLTAEPDLASHEAAALDEAQRAGLPAPRLVAYAADDVGFGAPVVLMSFIAGAVELRPADFPGLAARPGRPACRHSPGIRPTAFPGVFAPG